MKIFIMKKILLLCFIVSFHGFAVGQEISPKLSASLDGIVQKFKERWRRFRVEDDSVSAASFYKSDHFNISISNNPIDFETKSIVLKNPNYTNVFEDYEENRVNYPVSYSVLHEGRLISLFENGEFVCHKLEGFNRDTEYEALLNIRKFKYHWSVNGIMYALSGNSLYSWQDSKWNRSKQSIPVKNKPILYGDDNFMVFSDCYGEFGGTIYFFELATGKTYFTESTCANSVLKKGDDYFVLAQLGHMMGSAEVKIINNPLNLTLAKKSEIGKSKDGQARGYTDKTMAYEKLLDLYGIQLFSTFEYKERQLYLAYLKELAFLAEIHENEIEVVHPLFENNIYTHEPITTTFGDYTLINMDFYGTALEREVSVLIIKDDEITKVDWNVNQSD